MKKKMIGELLIETGLINEYQLARALGHQKQWGGKIGGELIRMGYIKEEDLCAALEIQLGVKWISLHDIKISAEAIAAVSAEIAKKHKIMPVLADAKTITIATTEPNDLRMLDTIGFVLGKRIKTVIAMKGDINWAIATYYDKIAMEPPLPRPAAAEPVTEKPAAAAPARPAMPQQPPPSGPQKNITVNDALESLVDLLVEKGIFTKEEFLSKLRS